MLINPSNFDIIINIVGRNKRNIFRAIPGRKPTMNDFMTFLQEILMLVYARNEKEKQLYKGKKVLAAIVIVH